MLVRAALAPTVDDGSSLPHQRVYVQTHRTQMTVPEIDQQPYRSSQSFTCQQLL
jgi:hypothetical protein